MKFVRHMISLSLLLFWGEVLHAQAMDSRTLNRYIHDFSQVGIVEGSSVDISDFTNKLKQKESPAKSIKFCRVLFNKTRQEFFRRYTQYATFSETLNKGRYNCLTGTALYALLLDHFGIDYTIIETNYHIFLLAKTDEGQALFEATDPINGFVTDSNKIAQRLQQYKRNTPQELPVAGKRYYAFMTELYQPVGLPELLGLLHYNVSIEAYNNQNFASSIDHLDRALNLYNSSRVAEFSTVLLGAILQSAADEPTKALYIQQLKSIRKKLPVMARRNYQH